MARMTMADRMAHLEGRGDELAGGAEKLTHPVHLATVDVLSDLMNMGTALSGGGRVPAHLRALMTMLDKGRPMLLDGIADLDPAAIQAFMAELASKIQRIVDVPTDHPEGQHDAGPAGAVESGTDLTQTA